MFYVGNPAASDLNFELKLRFSLHLLGTSGRKKQAIYFGNVSKNGKGSHFPIWESN